jgi:hypothetical protein
MNGNIESTNINILTKLNILIDLIEIIKSKNISINESLVNHVNEINYEYEMGSINILSNYFNVLNKYRVYIQNEHTINLDIRKKYNDEQSVIFNNFQIFIKNENFVCKLDNIFKQISFILSVNKLDKLPKVCEIILLYTSSTLDKAIVEIDYEKCNQCNVVMHINSSSSELICKICGIIIDLHGTIFEEDQFYYQDGSRSKHCAYDPSKHCRFWVDRIQAKKTIDIPQSIISDVAKCIINDRIRDKLQITCYKIRTYLHNTGNSKYNEHISLIRKMITGISPPQLSDRELQLLFIYFDKVIHIFDDTKPKDKTNCPYHPYFIYKIIEQIITENKKRKKDILSCIHLQSRETLIENDKIWYSICDVIPEFTYIPTDKNNKFNY